MITNKQIKELERLFNSYSCELASHKDEEKIYDAMMIGAQKAIGILGYEIEFEGETVSYGYASYGVKYETYKLKKKKDSQHNEINAMTENIIDLISDLEDKRASIEDKALKEGRDMTKKEQKKYNEINKKIRTLDDCIWQIENVMGYLEDYKD